jgi:protein required for attachment to host cells
MKPVHTWIVVADGARARFLLHKGIGKGLARAMDHDMANELLPNREIVSDDAGRYADPGGGSSRVEPTVDYHEFEKERFSNQVARVVNKARAQKQFDRLVLVAPPKTLGYLREELDKHTRELVYGELHKDLTNIRTDDLQRHLGEVMAV